MWLTLQQLKKECKKLGIISQLTYKKRYKEIKGAPANPYRFYKGKWVSWFDLFGKHTCRPSLGQLKIECKRLGITSSRMYKKRYKEIKGAPVVPSKIYKEEWISWYYFFGRISLQQLKEECRKLGIRSTTMYQQRYKEIEGAPGCPPQTYNEEWISWKNLFDTEFISLEQLKEECKKLGIKSTTIYQQRYKEIKGAPSYSGLKYVYKEEWISWNDFFGRVEKFITLQQLKKECKELRIISSFEYLDRYKEIKGAPSNPKKTYKEEWISWFDLFDKVKARLTLQQLKEECDGLGITNSIVYKRRYKEIKSAPSYPSRFYKEEWISWFDFFVKRITLQQLKEECNRLGINTRKEYLERYKEIEEAPSNPKRVFRKLGVWVSWNDLFGRDEIVDKEVRTLCRELGFCKMTSRKLSIIN